MALFERIMKNEVYDYLELNTDIQFMSIDISEILRFLIKNGFLRIVTIGKCAVL